MNQLIKIDEATYRIEEYNGMVYGYLLIGSKKAIQIDTGLGFLNYLEFTRELTDLPIEALNTHGHLDHITGNASYERVYLHPADQAVYSAHSSYDVRYSFCKMMLQESEECIQRLSTMQEKTDLIPIHDGQEIDLGDRTLEIIHVPGHTPGSIAVLDRERRTLFSGDTVCAEGVLLQVPFSLSVETFRQSMQKLKAKASLYDRIYPGHHKKLIDHSYIDEYIRCAETILANNPCNAENMDVLTEQTERIAIAYTTDQIWETK